MEDDLFPVPMFGWIVARDNGFHLVDCITEKRSEAWSRFEEVMGTIDGDEWIGKTTFRRYWKAQGYKVFRVRCQIV